MNFMKKTRHFPVLLAVIVVISIGLSAFDDGKLFGFLGLGKKGNMAPSDNQENMYYTQFNYCTSENILERSGFAFKNTGNQVVATELNSGISVPSVTYSNSGIKKYSEYVSYIYTLNGSDLYRSDINGKRNRILFKNIVDYELMGDYLYFIQSTRSSFSISDPTRPHDPINVFYRSKINGGYKEEIFDLIPEYFWASSGNLAIQRLNKNGLNKLSLFVYNVIKQKSAEVYLQATDRIIGLDLDNLYFYRVEAETVSFFRRQLFGEIEEPILILSKGKVIDTALGTTHLAILFAEEGTNSAKLFLQRIDDLRLIAFNKKFDPPLYRQPRLDISTMNVYLTTKENETVYSSLETEEWKVLELNFAKPDPKN